MRAHEFRLYRRKLGLTQDELADELGISKRQIGRYEAGRSEIPDRTKKAFELLIATKAKEPTNV